MAKLASLPVLLALWRGNRRREDVGVGGVCWAVLVSFGRRCQLDPAQSLYRRSVLFAAALIVIFTVIIVPTVVVVRQNQKEAQLNGEERGGIQEVPVSTTFVATTSKPIPTTRPKTSTPSSTTHTSTTSSTSRTKVS